MKKSVGVVGGLACLAEGEGVVGTGTGMCGSTRFAAGWEESVPSHPVPKLLKVSTFVWLWLCGGGGGGDRKMTVRSARRLLSHEKYQKSVLIRNVRRLRLFDGSEPPHTYAVHDDTYPCRCRRG